ncbi:NDR1/HIN1-like 25 [Striga hermonthica]|uniref:NDR1/HIN1-like 25 n=1 Tax=Striga hermonthica TaxID=68872 RepID=A0A9N7R5J3_STRHE|nr:NDR1/HIN1-like 25 [Striga hermonthica]
MADVQKVHPVAHDPEAPPPPEPNSKPTAPLVPRGSSRSESGDPARTRPPPTGPAHRTIPYAPMKPPKRRGSCCKRCLCWSTCLILLLVVLAGAAAGVLYLVFRPHLPSYSVDSMRISRLDLGPDNTLSSGFDVNITARNPNRRIGIHYEGGSRLSVLYRETTLCEGSLPRFYQGHRNTTRLGIRMAGRTADAAGLLGSIQAETGGVPLVLRGRVPVRVEIGSLRLWEWRFRVRCRLTVNRVEANNDVRIRDSRCRFRFRF